MGTQRIPSVFKAELGSQVDWTVSSKAVVCLLPRSLTHHRVDSQVENQQYRPALALIETLLRELKRLDDKMILTEVHFLESRVNHATKNYSKAKVCRWWDKFEGKADRAFFPGCSDVGQDICRCYLLSAFVASSAGYAIGCLAHGGQGLQDRASRTRLEKDSFVLMPCPCQILLLLRDFRGLFRPG